MEWARTCLVICQELCTPEGVLLWKPSGPKAGTRTQASRLFFLRQPSRGCLPGVPWLGQLFLLNLVSVRAACQGVSCIPRDQGRGPRISHPGAQKQRVRAHGSSALQASALRKIATMALGPQGQHTFVLFLGILVYFFQNNGGVCVSCEGTKREQCCFSAPSPDHPRGHACRPCSAVRVDLCLGSDNRRQGREGREKEEREFRMEES